MSLMNYKFENCSMDDVKELILEYASSLSSPFDSFLEDHIAASEFYRIFIGLSLVGYLAIFKKELLTQFYIKREDLKYGQEIFRSALQEFRIKEAFVTTGDELLLSLAMDDYESVEKQAYFFQDCKEYSYNKGYYPGEFRLASSNEIEEIEKVSGDFFDKLYEQVENGQIFIFKENDVLLGVGIREPGVVLDKYTSIGMFVNEGYRQKGIGRTIISKLREWCYENTTIPICGCWYYNTNSKLTLESTGFVTKTRLLRFKMKI